MVPIKCLQPGLPGMERSSPAVVAITPEVGSVLHIMEISFLTRPFAAIFSGVAVVILLDCLGVWKDGRATQC